MTRKVTYLLFGFLGLLGAGGCSTEDVDFITEEPSSAHHYVLSDVAFAEYLMYNATLPASNANALPFGICISRNDTFFLDTEKAATVRNVYLVKDSKRVEALEAAGVASAAVKIENIDGIRYFNNCTNLKLTSNTIRGELDLTSLTRLDTLEMNANMVSRLSLPASITRLRYSASANASEEQRLTAIDLSSASSLRHLFLTNHRISSEGLQLPASYAKMAELDLTGNPEAPFEIPEALYNQLTIRNGVIVKTESGGGEPEIPEEVEGYKVPDIAFAEYLLYLTEKETNETYRLPAGTVYREENQIYIHPEIAKTFNGVLNISKASAYMTTLENAGVASAKIKIADADGLQLFTSLKQLVATSNAFTADLPLDKLTQLDSLVVRTAGVEHIDLSNNTALRYLDIQGSASKSLKRLQKADLSKNINLYYVNLSANEIDPQQLVLPTSYAFMQTFNMGGNKVDAKEVSFTVPAAFFDQLGNSANDKAGLIRGE